MRFSIRQLLLYMAALSVWFGLVAQAHYTFGPGGVLVYGSLFGISILMAVKLILRWTDWTATERGMCALALILALSGGIYVASIWYGYGLNRVPLLIRDANHLQKMLRADARFESVLVSYVAPTNQKKEWLWVRGTVNDQDSLDALRQMIDEEEKWHVEWRVDVVPK